MRSSVPPNFPTRELPDSPDSGIGGIPFPEFPNSLTPKFRKFDSATSQSPEPWILGNSRSPTPKPPNSQTSQLGGVGNSGSSSLRDSPTVKLPELGSFGSSEFPNPPTPQFPRLRNSPGSEIGVVPCPHVPHFPLPEQQISGRPTPQLPNFAGSGCLKNSTSPTSRLPLIAHLAFGEFGLPRLPHFPNFPDSEIWESLSPSFPTPRCPELGKSNSPTPQFA